MVQVISLILSSDSGKSLDQLIENIFNCNAKSWIKEW